MDIGPAVAATAAEVTKMTVWLRWLAETRKSSRDFWANEASDRDRGAGRDITSYDTYRSTMILRRQRAFGPHLSFLLPGIYCSTALNLLLLNLVQRDQSRRRTRIVVLVEYSCPSNISNSTKTPGKNLVKYLPCLYQEIVGALKYFGRHCYLS